MSGYTAPPGDTFEERWPDEAAERNWLSGPWLPIVLGGFAGLFGAPLYLLALFGTWSPVSWVIGAMVLGLLTLGVLRTSGRPSRILGRLWRIAAFVALSLGLGLVMWLVNLVVCDQGRCGGSFSLDQTRFAVSAMMFAAAVLGSILIAMWVDRAGKHLAARARATAAP